MNKENLVSIIAEKTGLTKKASEKVVSAFTEIVSQTLSVGEPVKIKGFGNFTLHDRPARTYRAPNGKHPIAIPAARVPIFESGKALKDKLKQNEN